ncbi:MAG: hypothetical protein JSR33_05370 [Proteobacteria bacterium]|nr:hypothetical protein [Pseudomonadota bacterium]
MDDTLLVLFCAVDEFCQLFMPEWEKHLLQQGVKKTPHPFPFDAQRNHDTLYLFSHLPLSRFQNLLYPLC